MPSLLVGRRPSSSSTLRRLAPFVALVVSGLCFSNAVRAAEKVATETHYLPQVPPGPIPDMRAHLEKVLAAKNEVFYVNTKLEDVIADLKSRTRANIEMDWPSLVAEGLGPQSVFTFAAKDISLRAILNRMFDYELFAWTVDDDTIWITTRDGAKARPVTKAYSVGFLAGADGTIDYDELTELITSSVDPESWRANGGDLGAIARLTARKSLVITQTYANHQAIADIFQKLSVDDRANQPKSASVAGNGKSGGAKSAEYDNLIARFERELGKPAEAQYFCKRFSDLAEDIEERYKLPALLDVKALNDDGRGPETIISGMVLKDLTLASLLDRATSDYGMRWTIVDENLLITSPDGEKAKPVRLVYSVAEFTVDGKIDYAEFAKMLKSTIAPDSWRDAFKNDGGEVAKASAKKAVVITQSFTNHRKIRALLKELATLKP